MLATFTVIPLGVPDGAKHLIAEALKIVDASGLSYQLGPMGTTLEGESGEVMQVVMQCHKRLLELAPRVMTSILIDERPGHTGRLKGKVQDVEELLGKPLRRE
ncbi:MAG: MTH1187 family thiamine-binding protein [Acidobacteriota bacterium]|nr:MTH1187 family thiamine-binding protein [Acidobacteriota bacterium]